MPNARVPAADFGLPSPLRRRLLLGAAAVSTLIVRPVSAQGPHPDASLLTHAPRLAELQAELDRRSAALDQAGDVLDRMIEPRPDYEDLAYGAWSGRWRLAKEESGYNAAEVALDGAVQALDRALDELTKIPALTLDGLCLKARYGHQYEAAMENIVADLIAIDRRLQA